MAQSSRHAAPLFVTTHGPPVVLQRMTLGQGGDDGGRREAFVQDLVHDHPDILPMGDVEPAFSPLISICKELPTLAGYLDNLWITPAGGIVLGECKLARNPQARREVIAQGLDYARAVNAWGYEDLEDGVKKALKDPTVTLWSLVEPHTHLTESEFVDAVQRRLKLGRFLILIIGDGIQEGVEALTSFLQLHAGLHVGLALVDLSIWSGAGDGLVVVPRIPMRTVLIERGIVNVDPQAGVKIDAPKQSVAAKESKSPANRVITASEPEFFEQLEQHRPGVPDRVRSFLAVVSQHGAQPEFRKMMQLKAPLAGDDALTLGAIDNYGRVWFGGVWSSANKLGHATAADAYLEEIASAMGGSVKTYQTTTPPEVFGPDGKALEIGLLLQKEDQWIAAMDRFVTATAVQG